MGWLVGALLLCAASALWANERDDQYSLAADHYSHSRWKLAAEEFEAFLGQFPDDDRVSNAAFYLGESLLQLKRYTDARTYYLRVVTRASKSPLAQQAKFRAAEALFLDGQHDEAHIELEAFDKEFGDSKLNAYSLAYRGQIAVDAGEAIAAESYYREAIRRFPDGPLKSEVRFGLATALELKGDNNEALRFYQFLAENTQSSLLDDAHLRAGILLYKLQQYDNAIEILGKFGEELAESPLVDQANYWSGMSLLKAGDASAAMEVFARGQGLTAEHPLAAAFEFGQAEACRGMGDSDGASQHYERVYKGWPTSDWADDSLYEDCVLSFSNGDDERFTRCAREFEEQYASSLLAKHVRQLAGRMALRQLRYDDAIKVFESLEAGATSEDQSNRYYLGVCLLAAGRANEALNTLSKINPADEADVLQDNVAVATAGALIELKRFQEAIEPLSAYLASQPGGADAATCRAKLAICYLETDKREKLEQAYQQYRKHNADSPAFLPTTLYLAEQSVAKGNVEFGRQLYAQLTVESNPEEFIAKGLAGLGQLQLAAGDTDGSANTFGRLLDKAAMSNEAPRAGLMRARSLEQAQKFDAALTAYRLVTTNYPDSPEASLALFEAGRLHDRLGQDQEAQELLEELLMRTPTIEQLDAVLYQLAWVLTDLGKPADSDAMFKRLVSDHPTSKYWADAAYRLAERAFQRGELETSTTYVEQLLSSELDSRLRVHSLYLQGQLAAQQEKWNDVAAPMNRLIDAFPQSELCLPARYWVAEAAFRRTDYQEAVRLFAQLADDISEVHTTWSPMVPLRLAQCLAHQEQWAEALETAKPIGEQFPDFRQLYEADYVIGRCLSMQARFTEARAAFTRVVRSTTGGRTETAAMAQWMIGESFFHQKDYHSAVKAYHRVVSLYAYPQWQAAALLQAGKCHEQSGEWREAVKLYTQLLRDYPETSYAADASQRLRVAQRSAAGTNN